MGNCSASDGDVSDKNNSSPENLPSPAIEIDPFFIAPKLWQPAPLPSLHFSQAEEDFVHKTTPRERGASQVPALVVDQSKEPKSVLEVLGRGSIDVGMVKQSKLDAPPMGDSAPKIVKRAKPWELLEFATTKDLLCFGGGSLLALAQGSCNPLISLLLGDGLNVAFDPFFTGSVEEELREVVYKLFGVLLLMFVTAAGWQALLIYSAERQCAQMRKDYFATLCKQDTAWFDLNDIAGLPNKMASEVMTIKEAVGVKYGLILLTVGNIMSGLITGAFKQFQTFMVCLAFVPPITAIGLFLSFTVGNSTKFQQKCFAKAGSAVEEILAAIRTVCAFGGEQQACDRFEAALDEALIGGVWGGLNMGLAMGGMIGTMQMMAPATFLYGAHEILNEADADQGSMVAAFSAIYLGLGSLQTVGDPLLACLKAMLCAAAMFDTMRNIGKIEAEELDPVPPQILHSVDRIEYEQVWFHYPSRPDVMILKGVDLSIVAGDKVAFCGGSGSGKSTIIQLLLRFYDPLSGVVRINGVDLKELPVRHYRRTIGYVGQEPILFATTVMENIKGGNMSFSDEECIAAARQAEAFDFLDQLPQKFHTFVGIGGGAMSGGQKQRVAIARALIKKPQVLLLDEATSALDNESEKMVQNTIDGLQKHAQEGEHKLTTLAIAHRLSTIRNSNKIICLQLGMIVEQGDHEHLMAKQGDYYGLVKAQEGNPAPPKAAAPNLTQLNYSIKKRVSAVGSGSSVSQPKEDSGFLQKAARRASQTMQNVAVQLASAEMQEEHAQMVEELTNPAIDVNKRLTAMIDHKGVMVIAFVCSVFAGAVMPINALVLTHMMETMFLIDKDEMQREMHVWVSIMGFNAAVAFLAELGKYSAFAYIAETLTMKLRCQFFRSIVRTEIGFFDDPQNAPAGISAMLSSMCGQVTKMIGMSLGNICHAFLSFFIGALLAMFGSWRLNLVILGTAPFLLFAMFIVVKMTSPSEGNDPWAPTYEVATETILNMRTVKALVSEEHSIQIFGTCIDKILLSEIKSCWKKGFAFGIGNSVIHIPQIIAFTYGAWLIDDGLESQKMFQTLYCLVFGVLSAGHASAFAPGAFRQSSNDHLQAWSYITGETLLSVL